MLLLSCILYVILLHERIPKGFNNVKVLFNFTIIGGGRELVIGVPGSIGGSECDGVGLSLSQSINSKAGGTARESDFPSFPV